MIYQFFIFYLQKTVEKISTFIEGCKFVVVGVSEDGSDPAGKTELIRQGFNARTALPALESLETETAKMIRYRD